MIFMKKWALKWELKKDPLSSICPYYLLEEDYDWFLSGVEKKYNFANKKTA